MFSKILIANRGEIAVRIARACAGLGVTSVAIYSDADASALHVRACDEAYRIGPAPAAESYLRGDLIIEVARKAGCGAIHPGYGFLSENATFARAVVDAGLAWIGPSPQAIELMGSKIESKRLAEKVGVPTVPGYLGDDQSTATLSSHATNIGYPVLIKASAGGGGKGMRVVERSEELTQAIEAARREAQSAFGDGSLLLEKYLAEPRHIEVQVFGDSYGHMVHLGERECSIQRRHQKVLEEAPSPALTDRLREQITADALKLAKAAGYSNAGTVEFIFEGGNYYFLEMNTRLQVEHPVTEEAIDFDLVQAQIRVASGEALWVEQDDLTFEAHAIEARIYAEDPAGGFLPSTGKITRLEQLQDARIDAGVALGDSITPYYDPMIAKVITSGETRREAISAMREALGGLDIQGPKTNLDFLRWLVAHPQFEMGNLSTRFIERYYRPGAFALAPPQVVVAAAALYLLNPEHAAAPARHLNPWVALSWRQARQAIFGSVVIEGHAYDARFSLLPGLSNHWQISVQQGENVIYTGDTLIVISQHLSDPDGFGDVPPSIQVQLEGSDALNSLEFELSETHPAVAIMWDERAFWCRLAPPLSVEHLGNALNTGDEDTLESPMPGKVLRVLVSEGERVLDEQPLVIIEAMKMEFTVKAPHDGKVARIRYDEGAQVAVGDILVVLEK